MSGHSCFPSPGLHNSCPSGGKAWRKVYVAGSFKCKGSPNESSCDMGSVQLKLIRYVVFFRVPDHDSLTTPPVRWVWVKINPPEKPQVLGSGSIYQGKPFWSYPIFDPPVRWFAPRRRHLCPDLCYFREFEPARQLRVLQAGAVAGGRNWLMSVASLFLAVGQKCAPKMACPDKWNQRLKPAVFWWVYFNPYPFGEVPYKNGTVQNCVVHPTSRH